MNDLGSAFSTALGLVATADPAVAQIVLITPILAALEHAAFI